MADYLTPLDRRLLLKHVTGCSDADMIITPDPDLTPDQRTVFDGYVQRRLNGEPVSKIIGFREFYSLNFEVNRHVLDPRPDSEVLVDAVLESIAERSNPKLLELGGGSGCLSVSVAVNHPKAVLDCLDISEEALAVARRNVSTHHVERRVRCVRSDWFEQADGPYDVIFSNPPYIESHVIDSLDKEVRDYDPILSLDGGKDGLDAYRIIFSQAKNYLYPQGALLVEHGAGQEGILVRLMKSHGFAQIRSLKDLSGTNRVLAATL